jgi:signal transduction histidine kinase
MRPKILLVDDRDDNLLSIESLLEPGGYQFIKASSGREALKILLTELDFALILMDVQMPNLNGFETAEMIYQREKLKHIPIVFITAHHYGEENIFKGYQAGAVDYIYKPINPQLLKAKVAVFIELYKKNHQLMLQEQKLKNINRNLEIEINEKKISEEKVTALNRKLLETIDRLEVANKDLDRFAFMASHDLQEPLRKIRMFSDRLYSRYQDSIDDESKLYINRIQHSAESMQNLIKDILTFSKISIEQEAFRETNLHDVLNEVLVDISGYIKEKNATVIVGELPTLHVNQGLIKPLFQNIIHNALKYSKKDLAPLIKVHSRYCTDDDDEQKDASRKFCRIYIEDNGIGFEQKYAEQIFGMFKRLHSKNDFEGTGIGLALCKKIVEEHGGFISAKSSVDQGSTFIISLPLSLLKNATVSGK